MCNNKFFFVFKNSPGSPTKEYLYVLFHGEFFPSFQFISVTWAVTFSIDPIFFFGGVHHGVLRNKEKVVIWRNK